MRYNRSEINNCKCYGYNTQNANCDVVYFFCSLEFPLNLTVLQMIVTGLFKIFCHILVIDFCPSIIRGLIFVKMLAYSTKIVNKTKSS